MNKMKRIFSFVLVFAMLVGSFSSFSAVAFAEEVKEEVKETVVEEVKETKEGTDVLTKIPSDVIGTEYEKAVTRLVAFGVITGYPDGSYKPEENINRVQFAKVVVVALGLGDAVPAAEHKATGFSDVQQGYWGAGYINVATGQGLLKGYPDGTFKPAQQVSYAEALTILVRALGYKDEFLQGRWPGSHVAKAAEVGITADVKMPADATNGAKRGNVAKLVNNALDAKVIKVDTYKPNTSEIDYYETDIPLLKDRLEISKYENTRVIGDKIVDDGLDKDEIRIRFLEDVEKYDKRDRYTRGEIVKRAYNAGDRDTYRHNDFVEPREIIGEEVTTYINDNDKVIYVEREEDDKAQFDYVEDLEKGAALNLVAFDRDYKFEEGSKKDSRRDDTADIFVFDSKNDRYVEKDAEKLNTSKAELEDLVGRMGKFVVKNNRIVYAEIMDPAETPDYMVVMENKDGQLKGINAENENFKKDLRKDQDYDYSVVYNTKGEKLALKDIKEGNVIYVQQHNYDGDDVAHVVVVQDNKVEGELGRVKHDRAEIDGKELKVVKYEKADEKLTYVASYAINDLEEVRRWDGKDSTWEDDMEDAYKETIVAYKDAVGRIAFLTTDGGNSGYKFGIITRTYSDSDRIRIFTTIDGKEGKDQIFKADKELDIEKPIKLLKNGLEPKDIKDARTEAKVGMAVKFRLNSDGEIAKEKLFVMPAENVYGMTDDFGKDIIKAIKVDDFENAKPDGKKGSTFAVNSDATTVIDAPRVGVDFDKFGRQENLDEKTMNNLGKIDLDDFDVTTWKDIKEDNQDDKIRFYIFPKNNKEHEVDGLVFIGKDGANTGSDEEAVYVIDQWKKGDKLFVEYVKYPENEKITREVDETDRLTDEKIEKERAYVGKEKSNGKIALTRDDKKPEDFDLYLGEKVEKIDGNYVVLTNGDRFLLSNSLVYYEDKSKTTSYVKSGMTIDIVTDGIRARVVAVKDNDGKGDSETSTTDRVTYINAAEGLIEVDGKVLKLSGTVRLRSADGKTTLAIGPKLVAEKLLVTDKVELKSDKDGVVTEIKLVKEDEEDPVDPEEPEEPEAKEIKGTFELGVAGMTIKVDLEDATEFNGVKIAGEKVDAKYYELEGKKLTIYKPLSFADEDVVEVILGNDDYKVVRK